MMKMQYRQGQEKDRFIGRNKRYTESITKRNEGMDMGIFTILSLAYLAVYAVICVTGKVQF